MIQCQLPVVKLLCKLIGTKDIQYKGIIDHVHKLSKGENHSSSENDVKQICYLKVEIHSLFWQMFIF